MDKEKIEEIQKRIREEISGKPEVQKLLEIKKLAEETNDLLRDKKSLDRANFDKVSLNLNELKLILANIASKEFPDMPEFPKELKISNISEIKQEKIEFPKNLKELKNIDLEPFIKTISEINLKATEALVKALSKIKITNKVKDEYIPVRIVYTDVRGNLLFDPEKAISGGSGGAAYHTGFKNQAGQETYVTLNADGTLPITATLSTGDIEIGAVEIKNSSDDTRATVGANGLHVDVRATDGVAAEGAALGNGILLQGDDGTDRKNINVDATTGDVQVDVTNTVTVNGSGVTQPVSGTVTANLSAVDNAVLDDIALDTEAIKTAVETIDNAIAGTEMQVDVVAALPAGTNAIGKLAANSGIDIGDVDITSISAGANLIGDVGISGARTSGGTSIFRSIDLDEGALEVVKGSAGQIYWIHAMNLATAVRYVKIYNATSGTIGTGTPVLTFPIPTQAASANGAGFVLVIPNGIAFSIGISIGASTGIADADTGAPSANDVVVNIGYA